MAEREARQIAAYRGYGNRERLWIRGRLLANPPGGAPAVDDRWWRNLLASFNRWESDEVPGARVHLRYGGQQQTVTTDREGYYTAEFATEPGLAANAVIARHATNGRQLTARHEVLIPHREARYLLISDVDDTVIHTGITSLLTAARTTFFENAHTRTALPGVAALYRAFRDHRGELPLNPVVYVSNSPWNLYDLLREFLVHNALPRGPLLLRDVGLASDTARHKERAIDRLLERYPELPVILVGDSGQHDASLYAGIARRHGGRVLAIYIRDVEPDADDARDREAAQAFAQASDSRVPMRLVADSDEIAEHAARYGLLPKAALAPIAAATQQDRDHRQG